MAPITIPTVSVVSTPPTSADPTNFASRADTFLAELATLSSQMASVVTELNKLAYGISVVTAPAAYNPATTYNFPDLVAYTDGYTYMCIGTGVVGEAPPSYPLSWKLQGMIPTVDSRLAVTLAGSASVTLDGVVYDVFDVGAPDQATLIEVSMREGRTLTLFFTNPGAYTHTFQVTNVDTGLAASLYWMGGELFAPSPTGVSSLTITLFDSSMAVLSYRTGYAVV